MIPESNREALRELIMMNAILNIVRKSPSPSDVCDTALYSKKLKDARPKDEVIEVSEQIEDSTRKDEDEKFEDSTEDIEFLQLDLRRLFRMGYSLVFDERTGSPTFVSNNHFMYMNNATPFHGDTVPYDALDSYTLMKIKNTSFSNS